jgi:hypothetical protein
MEIFIYIHEICDIHVKKYVIFIFKYIKQIEKDHIYDIYHIYMMYLKYKYDISDRNDIYIYDFF